VSDDRVFVFGRDDDREIVRALDLATGKALWSAHYAAPYTMNPAATGHGKGPKSTPVVHRGRLHTLGIAGILSAFEARTGALLWRKDSGGAPDFGTAMSPLVDGAHVIAHVGGGDTGALTAFDAATGAVVWRWNGDGPAYASPIIAAVGARPAIVTQTRHRAVALDPGSGSLRWSAPFTTPYEQNSVTPVAVRDGIVLAGLQQPTTLWSIPESGAAIRRWESRDATMYMSTPVASDGRLYGFSDRRRGQLVTLDAATGKTLWQSDGRLGDNASVWASATHLLVLTTDSTLIVFEKKPDGALAERARHTVADTPTWASPAFTRRGVLIKDASAVALWTWA
jgi:outer membrane protein assembly factor BamB